MILVMWVAGNLIKVGEARVNLAAPRRPGATPPGRAKGLKAAACSFEAQAVPHGIQARGLSQTQRARATRPAPKFGARSPVRQSMRSPWSPDGGVFAHGFPGADGLNPICLSGRAPVFPCAKSTPFYRVQPRAVPGIRELERGAARSVLLGPWCASITSMS